MHKPWPNLLRGIEIIAKYGQKDLVGKLPDRSSFKVIARCDDELGMRYVVSSTDTSIKRSATVNVTSTRSEVQLQKLDRLRWRTHEGGMIEAAILSYPDDSDIWGYGEGR